MSRQFSCPGMDRRRDGCGVVCTVGSCGGEGALQRHPPMGTRCCCGTKVLPVMRPSEGVGKAPSPLDILSPDEAEGAEINCLDSPSGSSDRELEAGTAVSGGR